MKNRFTIRIFSHAVDSRLRRLYRAYDKALDKAIDLDTEELAHLPYTRAELKQPLTQQQRVALAARARLHRCEAALIRATCWAGYSGFEAIRAGLLHFAFPQVGGFRWDIWGDALRQLKLERPRAIAKRMAKVRAKRG